MAITRIAFNDTAAYDSSEYYVPLNPSKLELNESDEHTATKPLDGAMIKQSIYTDSRPFILSWSRIPSGYANFATMLTTLKGYLDGIKYVNFGTADYRISPSSAWVRVRVANVSVKIQQGGGIKYNVEVTLFPEAA